MSEELGNHGGVFDGGDDLQCAAAVRAFFNIDIEHAAQERRPGQPTRPARALRVGRQALGPRTAVYEPSADGGAHRGVARALYLKQLVERGLGMKQR